METIMYRDKKIEVDVIYVPEHFNPRANATIPEYYKAVPYSEDLPDGYMGEDVEDVMTSLCREFGAEWLRGGRHPRKCRVCGRESILEKNRAWKCSTCGTPHGIGS